MDEILINASGLNVNKEKITHIINKANIPNIKGFRFMAVMPNGVLEYDEVYTNEIGQHRSKHFKEMIGWLRII